MDIRLKDGDGLSLLEELRRSIPAVPIIMATAFGDSERTIAAMKRGAFDYVTKPFDLDLLLATITKAVHAPTVARAEAQLEGDSRLLGQSARMLDVWKAIGRAAASDAAVLITGETGVGKELVATAIHRNSKRSAEPMVAVNIAALPPTLVESELFGHERGAFTGAMGRREGRFEMASKGTLFLDEIGDLDVALQTKLQRVLQDGVFERVGSQESFHSSARVIAATSKPVNPNLPGSSLRDDLFYRLGAIAIEVPPLRERRSDIPILVHSFLNRLSPARRAVSEEAMAELVSHDWPGNVRELFHVLERACVMSASEVLDSTDFELRGASTGRSASTSGTADDLDIRIATAKLEKQLIERALRRAQGNRAEAARLLGLPRTQL